MTTYTAKDCRHALVDAMLALWVSDVRDFDEGQEPTPEKIADLLRRVGWGWALGKDGTYQERDAMWCGLAVGAAGTMIGDHLADDRCVDASIHEGVARHVLPSCDRLASRARWDEAGVEPAESVRPANLRRGDIATVGSGQNGSHIVLIREAAGDSLRTVEANARGTLPDGSWGEGIVKRSRVLDEVACGYRLGSRHFVGDALEAA